MTEVSLIIRTHNEEKWIGECLRAVDAQTFRDFEIVLVDNLSTDKTVEKARTLRPDLSLLEIEEYLPGMALNEGIRASSGEYVVCLSAHCVPVDTAWLTKLRRNFDEHEDVAGVYGRQLPIESSDPVDKRDLLRTFGPEKRIQTRDTFFHNANSMISREIWEKFSFDEEVNNIEDQIWANAVLEAGYSIVYEPEAAVYHHHGINQGNDRTRLRNVLRTMEKNQILSADDPAANLERNPFDPAEADIVSFIPVRKDADTSIDSSSALIRETIDAAAESTYVDDIFVTTDSKQLAERTQAWGATAGVLRPEELSASHVDVVDVYRYTLEQLEEDNRFPDLVVTLDITHPFRPPAFVDAVVEYLVENGHDTVVPVYPERRPTWIRESNELQRLNENGVRSEREPVQIGLFSLGTVMYPHILRSGDRLSGDVGLYAVDNPLAVIEIRDQEDLEYWERLRDLPKSLETEAFW